MEKEYLSIKEVAQLQGVSYQAVYKRLNTTLKNYVEVVEGRKMLRVEVLDALGLKQNSTVKLNDNSTVEEKLNPNFNDNSNASSSQNEEEIIRINKRNEEIIDDLRAQLREKDKQIKEQSEHIVNLSGRLAELFENQQKLEANYQFLLGDGKLKEQDIVEVDAQGAEATEDKDAEKPKEKGFLRRLFNF